MTEEEGLAPSAPDVVDADSAALLVRLRSVAPRDGWGAWLRTALRDELVDGVRSGRVEGDVAKNASARFVDRRSPANLTEALDVIYDLAFQFPELDASLDGIRVRILEHVEPYVVERALADLRAGHPDAALDTTGRFLELAEWNRGGNIEPLPLLEALTKILLGEPE